MSQTQKILTLLSDKRAHRTDEFLEKCYGNNHLGLARLGARIYDLKRKGHLIVGWKDKDNPTLYWYQLLNSHIPQYTPHSDVLKPSSHLPATNTEELKEQPRLFDLPPVELKINLPY